MTRLDQFALHIFTAGMIEQQLGLQRDPKAHQPTLEEYIDFSIHAAKALINALDKEQLEASIIPEE